eukprot:6213343-Pleurochrysis_carterae.AAC.11
MKSRWARFGLCLAKRIQLEGQSAKQRMGFASKADQIESAKLCRAATLPDDAALLRAARKRAPARDVASSGR